MSSTVQWIRCKVKENTEDLINAKVKEAVEIERECTKRARNLCITNISEPVGTSEEKQKQDCEVVMKLFTDHMKLKESDIIIQGTWRLGKVNADNTPRILKVILDREYMISTLLKATSELQKATDAEVKKISIFKDLTKEDREQRRKLVKEMKTRNEALKQQRDPISGEAVTDKWLIRNEKLVLVDKDYKQKSF